MAKNNAIIENLIVRTGSDVSGVIKGYERVRKETRQTSSYVGSAFKKIDFSGVGSSLSSMISSVTPSFQGLEGLISSMFSPAGLGLGGIVAGFALIQTESRKAENILRESRKMGISSDMFQTLEMAADDAGMSIQTAEKAVQKMRLAIGDTGKAKLFEQLGLDQTQLKLLTTEQQFSKIGQAILGVADPIQRLKMETEVFSKAGMDIEPLLEKMGDLEQYQDRIISKFKLMSLEKLKIETKDYGLSYAGGWAGAYENWRNMDGGELMEQLWNPASARKADFTAALLGMDVQASKTSKTLMRLQEIQDQITQAKSADADIKAEAERQAKVVSDAMGKINDEIFKASHSANEAKVKEFEKLLEKENIIGDKAKEATAEYQKQLDILDKQNQATKQKVEAERLVEQYKQKTMTDSEKYFAELDRINKLNLDPLTRFRAMQDAAKLLGKKDKTDTHRDTSVNYAVNAGSRDYLELQNRIRNEKAREKIAQDHLQETKRTNQLLEKIEQKKGVEVKEQNI